MSSERKHSQSFFPGDPRDAVRNENLALVNQLEKDITAKLATYGEFIPRMEKDNLAAFTQLFSDLRNLIEDSKNTYYLKAIDVDNYIKTTSAAVLKNSYQSNKALIFCKNNKSDKGMFGSDPKYAQKIAEFEALIKECYSTIETKLNVKEHVGNVAPPPSPRSQSK